MNFYYVIFTFFWQICRYDREKGGEKGTYIKIGVQRTARCKMDDSGRPQLVYEATYAISFLKYHLITFFRIKFSFI